MTTSVPVATPDSVRWNEATKCVERGDLASALSLFIGLDADGEHYAATEIGNLYEFGGRGVARDFEEAAKWYRKAIFHLDDRDAHFALARLHLSKQIASSSQEAFQRHALAAAHKGQPIAFLMLGTAYENGAFGPADVEQARNYYELAVQSGLVLARRRLASIALKSGRPLQALALFLRSIVSTLSISLRNPTDPRLTGLIK